MVKVCVTGAAGQIAYSLIFKIARGEMFGESVSIDLTLLDIEPMLEKIKGVEMELQDCAYSLLNSIVITSDPNVAFQDVEWALLVGAMPRRPGMQRKDLLQANAGIFRQQGASLAQHAHPNVRVLVVGNPANTNALITYMSSDGKIPKDRFTALTRLDHNRARSSLARKSGQPISSVQGVSIWGNHSQTQFPCVDHGTIGGVPVREVIGDDEWLNTTFIEEIQNRGATVMNLRGLSSAGSAAQAIVDHVRDWAMGSEEIVSMAVVSDGSYGVPKDLIFSFPLKVTGNGKYEIVQGLTLSPFAQEKVNMTTQELLEEKQSAFQ